MQLRDFKYALHIVSLHLHDNRPAQNFFSYSGPYDPNSFLFYGVNLDWYHSHYALNESLIFYPKLIFAWYCFSLCIVLVFLVTYVHRIFEEHPYVAER